MDKKARRVCGRFVARLAGLVLPLAVLFAAALLVCGVVVTGRQAAAAEAGPKPKVAVFPLAGDAADALKERCGYALRAKLDRDGRYEVIQGPDMKEMAEAADAPVGFDTPPQTVAKLAADAAPAVLIWGELKNAGGERATLRLRVLDLREKDAKPRELTKSIDEPTDLRFATEQVLETLPGVAKFEHPNEEAVHEDELSKALWAKNPNLVPDGDFAGAAAWTALYKSEHYAVKGSDQLPETDKVNIYRLPPEAGKGGGQGSGRAEAKPVLAMRLSRECAENNGLACLSEPIPVQPNTRYRISFRYKSDGPSTHVFVKGYATGKDVKGDAADREIFRTQVNPTGPTEGQWKAVVADVNPDHPKFRVEKLRVDLYAYLEPGTILWDDVTLKAVGPLKERATDTKDRALAKPAEKGD